MGTSSWTMVSPRDNQMPVLPLGDRRSIVVAWPEGSFCSECGTLCPSGYVGPVLGDRATFPDRRLVLVCRRCALRAAGVAEEGLDTHRCNFGCTDRLHLEVVPATPGSGPEAAAGSAARREVADRAAARFEGTPWTVVDVTDVSRALAAKLDVLADEQAWVGAIALWIEIGHALAWPETALV